MNIDMHPYIQNKYSNHKLIHSTQKIKYHLNYGTENHIFMIALQQSHLNEVFFKMHCIVSQLNHVAQK